LPYECRNSLHVNRTGYWLFGLVIYSRQLALYP
jgi:hypothetical protein